MDERSLQSALSSDIGLKLVASSVWPALWRRMTWDVLALVIVSVRGDELRACISRLVRCP